MQIRNFDDLLEAARAEREPQRMLFVFVKSVPQKDYSEDQMQQFRAGLGGALLPLMSVDKEPEGLADFDQLVREAKQRSDDWDKVLVACLGGQQGRPPARAKTDAALDEMIRRVEQGADLSRYLCFDRDAEPVFIAPVAT